MPLLWLPLLPLLSAPARAADTAVGLTGAWAGAAPSAALEARWRLPADWQVGAEARLAGARGTYLDGWPVTAGTTRALLVGASAPLARGPRARIDLRVDLGARQTTGATVSPGPAGLDRQTAALAELSPVATVRVGEDLGAQLGWTAVFARQLQPAPATDLTGQLVRVGLAGALTPSWQWVLRAEAGGLFGYDGDGAKALLRGTAGLRFVPGHAGDWFHP